MFKRILTLTLFLGLAGGLYAQIDLVNPTPQDLLRSGAELSPAPQAWLLSHSPALQGTYALKPLQDKALDPTTLDKAARKGAFTLTLGLAGDKAVKAWAKEIPAQAEGYYLNLSPTGAVIAGRDLQGLYYGVQTFLAGLQEGKLETCTIKDWPDVPFRGVVEGFYGTPWSHEARLDQLTFYGQNKMNVYIYGPKDDPWHRDHWRDPYPALEGQRIAELARKAQDHGVNFYWAIHPGVDIKWNDQDRDKLLAKFEVMYGLGVRSFAVFFDDIWGEGAQADKQAALLNYIDEHFVQAKPDVAPLLLCPTEYNRSWANEEKGYLRTLGARLNKSVNVMWTGDRVVTTIHQGTLDFVNPRIQRKAYIWWNFPVSDFVRDRMLLGPVYGNDSHIAPDLSGFTTNPMQYPEASKIAIYGVADYTWNMAAYRPQNNWEKALKAVLPAQAAALRTFALYNKDLGPNNHGFRREEGEELQELVQKITQGAYTAQVGRELGQKAQDLDLAADLLLADKSNPRLIHELTPWLQQAKLVAAYAQAVRRAADRQFLQRGQASFEDLYAQVRSLQEQMYRLEGSPILHEYQTGVKLATKAFLPLCHRLFTQAVTAYNQAQGSQLDPEAEYRPYTFTTTLPQLQNLAVNAQGDEVKVAPSNEVIAWPAGGSVTLEMKLPIRAIHFECNLGVEGQAANFTLEALSQGRWVPISLTQAQNNLLRGGQEADKLPIEALRLTNSSGKTQEVYFKHFRFIRR